MRKPNDIRVLYIDFDSFFAGVEEQTRPQLAGKPIGVTPQHPNVSRCIIAANPTAKRLGVKNLMSLSEARKAAPNIIFVEQSPHIYEKMHRRLLFEIESQIPIDAVCSIDELCCKLDKNDIQDPDELVKKIKGRIRNNIGPLLTCSMGLAANRQLAKIACEMNKPDGYKVIRPKDMPRALLDLSLDKIPGIGRNMRTKLNMAGINDFQGIWDSAPKQLRQVWGNVNGERFWYAIHGYEIQADPVKRSMYGHGRVLPPELRYLAAAYEFACILTTKAARRLRSAKMVAYKFTLWLKMHHDTWARDYDLTGTHDDQSGLFALAQLWKQAEIEIPKSIQTSRSIAQVHVAFHDLQEQGHQQFDIFHQNEPERAKWLHISQTLDTLNRKYAKQLVKVGTAVPQGKYAGGKISYNRVPDMEDFW